MEDVKSKFNSEIGRLGENGAIRSIMFSLKRWLYALWPLLSWIAGILLFGFGIYKWSFVFIGWAIGAIVVVVVVSIVVLSLGVWVGARLKEHDKAHPPSSWQSLREKK